MATALSAELDDEQFLTCRICYEILTEPRTLPCFHSFCKACLSYFVEGRREKGLDQKRKDFNCPECNRKFTIKHEAGVEGMGSNSFVRNKLFVFNIQRQAKTESLQCSQCQGQAICRCCDCEVSLCEKCFESHQSKDDNNTHSVLSLFEMTLPENAAKLKPKFYCKKHEAEKKPVKFFCKTCEELICKGCMESIHVPPEHECCPLEEAAAERREKLKAHCEVLRKQLQENNDSIKSLSDTQECLRDTSKKVIDDIIHQKEILLKTFVEKINEQAELLKKKVEEDYNKKLKDIEEQESEVKNNINKLKGALYSPPDQDDHS